MSKLIDADMVRQGKFCLSPLHADNDDTYYYQLGWNSAIETICDCVPTVDAVEVVRCKDCVHCKHFNDVWYLPKRDELLCTRRVETYHTTENDYCSWGERREDE